MSFPYGTIEGAARPHRNSGQTWAWAIQGRAPSNYCSNTHTRLCANLGLAVGVTLGDCMKFRFNFEKSIYHQRVEVLSSALANNADCFLPRKRWLIDPPGNQCVIDICQCHQPG